jgi:hypothetical protein
VEPLVADGETEGQQKAATITRSRLRAMLESAHGIMPSDDSQAAVTKRQVAGWGAFDGLRFCARVGVEKSKDPQYADKNVLFPLTPDDDRYISPGPQANRGGGAATAKPAAKPATNGAAKACVGFVAWPPAEFTAGLSG